MSRMWLRRIGIALAVWVVVDVVSALAHTDPQPVLLAALVGVGAVALWLAMDMSDDLARANWATWSLSGKRRRGADVRVGALQRSLEDIATRQDAERLHPVLVGLVDERLQANHGVDRDVDPHRASELMGPELTLFVAAPPAPVKFGNLEFLSRIVGHIEQL